MNAEPATGKDTEKAGKTKYKQEPEFKVWFEMTQKMISGKAGCPTP
jgi:hypothetical protein